MAIHSISALPRRSCCGKLVVDVLSLKEYPKQIMLDVSPTHWSQTHLTRPLNAPIAVAWQVLPQECDLLCTHPMFGPESAGKSWQSQPFVYDQVRVTDFQVPPELTLVLPRADGFRLCS